MCLSSVVVEYRVYLSKSESGFTEPNDLKDEDRRTSSQRESTCLNAMFNSFSTDMRMVLFAL